MARGILLWVTEVRGRWAVVLEDGRVVGRYARQDRALRAAIDTLRAMEPERAAADPPAGATAGAGPVPD